MNTYIEFANGALLDLLEVSFVGTLQGDKEHRSYRIYLHGGKELEIYEEFKPRYQNISYPRERFVEFWKSAKGQN
ncbi:hypothetical protein ACQ4M3_19085 [Leptolyngbya sp. AN03gr2]|uniref:hypothetical protein n=1 Tax=Leptolyngbya sp. AN03gr2 TaxID=3423364 RepID=UPI003D320FC9